MSITAADLVNEIREKLLIASDAGYSLRQLGEICEVSHMQISRIMTESDCSMTSKQIDATLIKLNRLFK